MVLILFLAVLQVLQDLFPAQGSNPSLKAWNPNPWSTKEFPHPTVFDTLVYLVLLMKKFFTCLIAHDNKEFACNAGETQVQSLRQKGPLEKEMAIHSSVLAWRIPGTGEPGGLPSMGSHRVGHD